MNDLLYVCSPYRGDTKRNKEYARKLTRAAINNGFVPVTVHLYLTEVTDDQNPEERSRGMAAGMKILENCKYILIGNKYGISDGMKAEMTLAALKGKVMLYEQDGKIYLVDSREETTGGRCLRGWKKRDFSQPRQVQSTTAHTQAVW